jgi:apolipoprotein N-acyltransferase
MRPVSLAFKTMILQAQILVDRLKPKLSHWLAGQRGLGFLAILSGLLTGLAHPPFGFLPGLLGFGLLLWICHQDMGTRPLRHAFLLGWVAGFFYFLIGCFWVAEAFLVDAVTFGWMAPLAVMCLPLIAGFFWGLTTCLYCWLDAQSWGRGVYFAACFSFFEIMRGFILTGFPWNPAGAAWRAGGAMSQLAADIGVYGLGFVTVATFSSLIIVKRHMGIKGFIVPIASVLILALVYTSGALRLSKAEHAPTEFVVRIVQPNVKQEAKWTQGAFNQIFMNYVNLTRAPSKIAHKPFPDLVIWPEGALPVSADELLASDVWTALAMSRILQPGQALIFGAYRSDISDNGEMIWRNSLLVLQKKADVIHIIAAYDKFKLVPFGEFLPFDALLSKLGIKSLVHVGDSFTPANRTEPLYLRGLPAFLPLICYEGLYPSLYQGLLPKPYKPFQMIINISNDAWFGATSGPVQHFNLSSYRAIEEGVPMIRSTPTGISGVIDAHGRPMGASLIGIGSYGYVDVNIPKALKSTPYSSHYRFFTNLLALFILLLVVKKIAISMLNLKAN